MQKRVIRSARPPENKKSVQNDQEMAKKINSFTLVFSKDKGEIYA